MVKYSIGRIEMIIRSVQLETVAGVSSKLPQHEPPEFAFWGRSNVGKSSLLNALVGRKSYARISSAPGKTATVNYYNVNGEFYLVDLPGYGYAKVSEKTREQWKKMTERYLVSSKSLKMVFLLLDMRHEPGTQDLEKISWILNKGLPLTVVLTKADKLSKNERSKMKSAIERALVFTDGIKMFPVSSEKKEGLEAITGVIEESIRSEQGK